MINIDEKFKFRKNDIIVVGCSTGPDSMALVDMLLKIRNKYNLSIVVAHVNHNVRKESFEEARYIEEYCNINGLLLESMVIEKYGDDNFHNEARNIRYNFFDNVVHKYGAHYLMTAHHGDDLMETILMRIVRGSNLNGYSGFKKIVKLDDYIIARPLIDYTKLELENYCKENNVKYYVDSSNSKDKYTRNRYRKYVIPFLKDEDKNVHHKFLRFSEELYGASKFIDKVKDEALKRCCVEGKLLIDKFILEDEFIQKEILYSLLNDFYNDDLMLVNSKHIDLIKKLIYSRKTNSFVNLPNDVIAKRTYNMIELRRETLAITNYEIEFDNFVLLPNNHTIEKIEMTYDNSNNICRLNSQDLALPLIVRTRHIGDKMFVKGMNGSRKIKDIFIDEKIKLDDRDMWPIVVDSMGNVVWIPGIKKSKYDCKKNENYDIILKYD